MHRREEEEEDKTPFFSTKATPYFITFSENEIETASLFCNASLSRIRFHLCVFVMSFFVFFSNSIAYLFYSITIRVNSLTYDVIYVFTKWNKFQCEKQFSVSFRPTHTEPHEEEIFCTEIYFIHFFVFVSLCICSSDSNNGSKKWKKLKKRKRTIICDLFDRYRQWKMALNRRLIAMDFVFVSLVLLLLLLRCMWIHPGWMVVLCTVDSMNAHKWC